VKIPYRKSGSRAWPSRPPKAGRRIRSTALPIFRPRQSAHLRVTSADNRRIDGLEATQQKKGGIKGEDVVTVRVNDGIVSPLKRRSCLESIYLAPAIAIVCQWFSS
jgi:hypothetical protein